MDEQHTEASQHDSAATSVTPPESGRTRRGGKAFETLVGSIQQAARQHVPCQLPDTRARLLDLQKLFSEATDAWRALHRAWENKLSELQSMTMSQTPASESEFANLVVQPVLPDLRSDEVLQYLPKQEYAILTGIGFDIKTDRHLWIEATRTFAMDRKFLVAELVRLAMRNVPALEDGRKIVDALRLTVVDALGSIESAVTLPPTHAMETTNTADTVNPVAKSETVELPLNASLSIEKAELALIQGIPTTTSSKRVLWRTAGDFPPSDYRADKPLVGTKAKLALWITGKPDPRLLKKMLADGDIWGREDVRGKQCTIYFKTIERLAEANRQRLIAEKQ